MGNCSKKDQKTPRKRISVWVAIMLLALALIGLYIGKALLKSPGDADSARVGYVAQAKACGCGS